MTATIPNPYRDADDRRQDATARHRPGTGAVTPREKSAVITEGITVNIGNDPLDLTFARRDDLRWIAMLTTAAGDDHTLPGAYLTIQTARAAALEAARMLQWYFAQQRPVERVYLAGGMWGIMSHETQEREIDGQIEHVEGHRLTVFAPNGSTDTLVSSNWYTPDAYLAADQELRHLPTMSHIPQGERRALQWSWEEDGQRQWYELEDEHLNQPDVLRYTVVQMPNMGAYVHKWRHTSQWLHIESTHYHTLLAALHSTETAIRDYRQQQERNREERRRYERQRRREAREAAAEEEAN